MWSPSRAAAQRAAKRAPTFYSNIDVSPFLAVVIVLLVILMTRTQPFHYCLWCNDRAEILHAVPQPFALREDAMRISVTRDGKFYFQNYAITPEDLPGVIRSALRTGAEKKIYLAVDARSQYGHTVAVIDQLQLAGITNVCLMARGDG